MARVSGFDLPAYLGEERGEVDRALERALGWILPLLPRAVAGSVRDGVMAAGKRLRPICCVAAFRACVRPEADDPAEKVYDLAVALELIHAYSLMHDDLPCMDDAPLRRGRPTPHTVYGEVATVLGGAALIPAAALQLWRAGAALGLSEEIRRETLLELSRAAGTEGMVGGQGLDLLGEGQALARAELDALHRGKTGALLTASLVLGGVGAGAPREWWEALRRYGEEVGLAFQITDDVLDATSDPQTLGKAPSDAHLAKSTYVGLLGVAGARAEAEGRVRNAVRTLREAGIWSAPLEELAYFVVERDH